jgi:hypothetical protein
LNFLKNVIIGIFVLAISAGIFFLLIRDQDVKRNILRSTLELVGDELLAMVPEGEQREALANQLDKFITKAENNELSEQQVEVTLARAFNMQLSPEKPSPAEIHAVLEAPLDSLRTLPVERAGEKWGEKENYPPHEIDKERLARTLRDMMAIKEDMIRVSQADSMSQELSKYTMFVADSGLQFVVDANIRNSRELIHNPDARRFFDDLSKMERVKFRKFAETPGMAEQALIVYAPFLPQPIRAKIVINADLPFDTLDIKIPQHFYNQDSLKKMINDAVRVLEQLENIE